MRADLVRDRRDFLGRVIDGLILGGWSLTSLPASKKLSHTAQLLRLESDGVTRSFRFFVYKAGHTGRSRDDERRIEITSTYPKGLRRVPDTIDVVLGYDVDKDVFIGFDRRRLEAGGRTGNATSFFSVDGLDRAVGAVPINIEPHASSLLGTEFHAFFEPYRIAEYLFNCDDIHSGLYSGLGPFSDVPRKTGRRVLRAEPGSGKVLVLTRRFEQPPAISVAKVGVNLAEQGQAPKRGTTPEELDAILAVRKRNGQLGEQHVLKMERQRLRRARKSKLASKVRLVADDDVSLGYDIHSFESDGRDRFIEVKTTGGTSRTFEMSANEWKVAEEKRDRYLIARVTRINERSKGGKRPKVTINWIADPVAAFEAGDIRRSPSIWRIKH